MRGLTDEDKPPLLRWRFPPGLKVVALIVISVVLMVVDGSRSPLSPIRGGVAVALQPFQIIAEVPADTINYLRRFFDRSTLIERNDSLSKQVLLLRAKLQRLAALKAENERIRALLDSARSIEQNVLIAEILSVSPSPYQHYVMLNKGSLDGVFRGQALIDANGIMGQVVNVTPMNSRALLITDSNHAIPVEISRTGLRTIAEGTGQSGQLHLPFLPKTTDVQVGDLLLTSGLGGRYPAGYPVAKVTEINRSSGSEFLDVFAQPTARLKHGSEVLLVWTQSDTRHDTRSYSKDKIADSAEPTTADNTDSSVP